MILAGERVNRDRVFEAVRATIRELHPQSGFVSDASSFPLLFKSADERIWVRIFYQPMSDFQTAELVNEIDKLKMLMPDDGMVYFFYPRLDQDRIFRLRSCHEHLAFFEYEKVAGAGEGKEAVKVSKWIPATELPSAPPVEVRSPMAAKGLSNGFFRYCRLTPDEIAGLNDIGFGLKNS